MKSHASSQNAARNGDAAQHEHREAVIAFWGSTKTETRTEYRSPSAVVDVDGELVTPDPLTLQELLQA